jgi:hypothetical protein
MTPSLQAVGQPWDVTPHSHASGGRNWDATSLLRAGGENQDGPFIAVVVDSGCPTLPHPCFKQWDKHSCPTTASRCQARLGVFQHCFKLQDRTRELHGFASSNVTRVGILHPASTFEADRESGCPPLLKSWEKDRDAPPACKRWDMTRLAASRF